MPPQPAYEPVSVSGHTVQYRMRPNKICDELEVVTTIPLHFSFWQSQYSSSTSLAYCGFCWCVVASLQQYTCHKTSTSCEQSYGDGSLGIIAWRMQVETRRTIIMLLAFSLSKAFVESDPALTRELILLFSLLVLDKLI
jgi:hypothetical protein